MSESRLRVRKTYKLYIGGEFPRSESGRSYPVYGAKGALLAHAEKYRCNECGFSGRIFYWHCPACHSWDSFEAYAQVKLR